MLFLQGNLFLVANGVPSEGFRFIVGDGANPPYDAKAHAVSIPSDIRES